MSMTRLSAVLVLCVGFAGGCAALEGSREGAALSRFEVTRAMMGTGVRIVMYAPGEAAAERAVEAAYARGSMLEARFTDYNPSSELSLLSATAIPGSTGQAVYVSDDLYDMLSVAMYWSHATDGAFDATVGPVVQLWRRARRTGTLPDAERLRAATAATGYTHMQIDPARRTVRLNEPGMRLDLGGIAKGYIADAMLAELTERGVNSALVDAGGNVVVSGAPPGKAGWVVGLMPMPGDSTRPIDAGAIDVRDAASGGGGAPRFVTLSHGAVATSGDAFQHVVIDGVRYSHIVDPATGLGLTTQIAASVVVLDREGRGSGATADALSTAICVMGAKRGIELIDRIDGAAALIVREVGGGVIVHRSAAMGTLRVSDEATP